MGNEQSASNKSNNHLFQVEIMLEEPSHALAIASLMQLLSHAKVKDFRITGGMELGKIIDAALASSGPKPAYAKIPTPKATPVAKKGTDTEEKDRLRLELLEEYKERGTLIRLSVVKGKGVRLSLPCRILNFDIPGDLLTVYHVDEKKVYSFKLNEIEDIVAHHS